jgi:CRP-like cAMP-binding protein
MMAHATIVEDLAPVRQYAAGDVIFRQGDAQYLMYIVRSGDVQIVRNGRVVETVGIGNVFGELEMVDHQRRHATAIAMSDCELVPVSEQTFVSLVNTTPNFALLVMRTMSERLQNSG